MDEDRNRGSSAGPVLIVGALLILVPLLYILSCGPAVVLINRGYLSEDGFRIVYYPLDLVARSSHGIRDSLEWYTRLWALRERNFAR